MHKIYYYYSWNTHIWPYLIVECLGSVWRSCFYPLDLWFAATAVVVEPLRYINFMLFVRSTNSVRTCVLCVYRSLLLILFEATTRRVHSQSPPNWLACHCIGLASARSSYGHRVKQPSSCMAHAKKPHNTKVIFTSVYKILLKWRENNSSAVDFITHELAQTTSYKGLETKNTANDANKNFLFDPTHIDGLWR